MTISPIHNIDHSIALMPRPLSREDSFVVNDELTNAIRIVDDLALSVSDVYESGGYRDYTDLHMIVRACVSTCPELAHMIERIINHAVLIKEAVTVNFINELDRDTLLKDHYMGLIYLLQAVLGNYLCRVSEELW